MINLEIVKDNTKKIIGRIEDICEDNEFEFFINGKAIDNLIDHCIYKYIMTDINESELLCNIFKDRDDYIDNLENYIEKTFKIKIDLLNWVDDSGEYSENELYKSINITGYKTFIKHICLQLIKK